MKLQKRKNMILIISSLVIAIISLTIVYAALSTNLKVTASNVTQNVASWNVGFAPATIAGKVYQSTTSTTEMNCGSATVESGLVTVGATTLSKPGDQCEWGPITVQNNGTIDAKLTSIITTAPSGVSCTGNNSGKLICGNITYWLYISGKVVPLDTIVKAGGTYVFNIYAEYSGSSLNSSKVTQTGVSFSLTWSQY